MQSRRKDREGETVFKGTDNCVQRHSMQLLGTGCTSKHTGREGKCFFLNTSERGRKKKKRKSQIKVEETEPGRK